MRFGIRFLLVLILGAALGLAWWRMRIDAVRERERAIELLVASPDPLGWDYDPSALIRTVNQLHSRGRQDAIETLVEFNHRYPNEGYSSPHQTLELVVPLLFNRRNPEDPLPRPIDWFDPSKGIELTEDEWSHYIVVKNGIPFHTVEIGGTSGMPGDQGYLVTWAREHARMRSTPMTPEDNPFVAAEAILKTLADEGGDDAAEYFWSTKRHIRMQVYRAVSHVLSVESKDDLLPYDDERWGLLKAKCTDLGLFWDSNRQAYSARKTYAEQ